MMIKVWGDDSHGQKSGAPTGNFKEIAGGSIQGLALRVDKTPVLWGAYIPPPAPGPIGIEAMPAPLLTEKFRAIGLGRDHAVLIHQHGTLHNCGQQVPSLANVPAGSYRAVAVAAVHAVAIAQDHTLKAWGSDTYSPPGGPPLTGLLNAPDGAFKAVEAAVLYSLALREDGALFGWGHGDVFTQLPAVWAPTPQGAPNFYIPNQTFDAIASGNVHALAILPDGRVAGWGLNMGGSLNAPTNVRFKAVAAGWGFSVGLSTNGTLWGWGKPFATPFTQEWTFASEGWTQYGQTHHYHRPGEHFKSVAAAAFHVMAIRAGQ